MRILFILENHYPNIGGVETLFKSLTENLVIEGFEVSILTHKFNLSLPSYEILNGVKIRRINFLNRYFFTVFGIFPALFYAFRHDVIHTTSYNAGIPSFVAGLISKRKVIITFHEVWGDLWMKLPFFSKVKLKGHQLFEKLLLKIDFDHYIAVSEYTKYALIQNGIAKEKITKIYNGIEYDEYNQNKSKSVSNPQLFRFSYYGRLGISKGIDLIIKAISILKNSKYSNFQVVLIIPKKPKSLYNKIRKLIDELQVQSFLIVIQSLSKTELIEELSISDAIIIPSYSEGFGFVAAESVAMGKQIIHSGKGALKEVVSGDHICMETFDAQGLANAMLKSMQGIFENSDIRHFRLADTIKEYSKLYKKIEKS